ncbi:MAG: YczE/YyaS/YitT family protein [Micrococcaceae bacterium]
MILRRVAQLLVGLFFYGVGLALLVRSMLGAAPWDVLTLGLSNHLPLSFGLVIIVVSVLVLLCWIPLRERPGIGTVLNALLVGPAADLALLVIPEVSSLGVRILLMLAGVVTVGAATGLYIGARFGPGPRDGLMTGLHRVTGKPIWVVRTGLEVIVVIIGWLLGGVFGVGTVVFALAIGPLCQFFIPLFDVNPQAAKSLDAAEASGVNERGRSQ